MAIKINGSTVIDDSQNGTLTGTQSVTGNVTGGNILTAGIVSASGNITGNYILGNGSQLTGIDATSIQNGTANVRTFNNGNVTTSAAGTANVLVVTSTGANVTGTLSSTGSLTVDGGTYGNVVTTQFAGVFATAAGPNPYSIMQVRSNDGVSGMGMQAYANLNGLLYTNTGITFQTGATIRDKDYPTGGTTRATIDSTGLTVTGIANISGNITGGNISTAGVISATGNVTGASVFGTIGTAAQPTITSLGTLTSLNSGAVSSSGNVTGANFLTGGLVSATGNITGASLIGTIGTAAQPTITSLGTLTSLNSGTISSSGNVTGASLIGTIGTAAQPTITSVGTLTSLNSGAISSSGNVTAPNLVVSTNIYDASTMTIVTGSGDIQLQPAGNVVVNSKYINGVTNPVQAQDVATKSYVDTQVSTAISYHEPVFVTTNTTLATATGGTITYTQPNGAGNGVGALLTTTGAFNLIDTGNVQTVGTRILVKNEANAVFNGVYTWANATNIVRSTDTSTYGAGNTVALGINDYFFTTGGNVNAGSAFVVSAPTGTITFGTSNISFAQFSSVQVYTANSAAGALLNGTVFSTKVDGTTTAFDGGGNISVKASATLTTPNIGVATGTSLSVTGAVTGASLFGTIGTAAQPTITSLGTLTSLNSGAISSSGNVTGTNILTGGIVSATGNITAGNISATNHTGTNVSVTGVITGASVVGGVMTGTSLSVTGNVNGANITGAHFGSGAGLTSIPNGALTNSSVTVNGTAIALGASGTVTATATNALTIGTGLGGTSYNGASAVTITNTGVLSLANGGGITASASTGAITLGSTATNANTASAIVARDASGNFSAGTITATLSGAATTAGTVTTAAQGNITSVGTLTSLNSGAISSSGTVTAANLTTAGVLTVNSANNAVAIVNGGTNGGGNIGGSGATFNTVFAKATTAQYADLAEKYQADAEYAPGTVLVFGGTAEVTVDAVDGDRRVAGVVSTDPGFLMNEGLSTEFAVAVALTGRVPCFVVGPVRKGDLMVAAGLGRARAEADPRVGTVIGKALEDFNGAEGTIEVVVGRF